jgi:hypothetical protein
MRGRQLLHGCIVAVVRYVAVTGSQKVLSLPTGLALVCASDKVRCGLEPQQGYNKL